MVGGGLQTVTATEVLKTFHIWRVIWGGEPCQPELLLLFRKLPSDLGFGPVRKLSHGLFMVCAWPLAPGLLWEDMLLRMTLCDAMGGNR